jgi:hypothetical protein
MPTTGVESTSTFSQHSRMRKMTVMHGRFKAQLQRQGCRFPSWLRPYRIRGASMEFALPRRSAQCEVHHQSHV